MSTTDNATASNGADRQDNPTQPPPSLPTFTSIKQSSERATSEAESSTSRSLLSASDLQKRSHSRLRESWSSSFLGDNDVVQSSEHRQRRKNRSSGGFLLNAIGTPTQVPKPLHVKSLRDNDTKGKRKSDNIESAAEFKRSKTPDINGDAGFAASPSWTRRRSGPSENASRPISFDERPMSSSGQNARSPAVISRPESVSYDTDPAQIVDMALRLSEGRRRQASRQAYAPKDDTLPRRTVGSAGNNEKFRVTSLGQYLVSSRPSSPSAPSKQNDRTEKLQPVASSNQWAAQQTDTISQSTHDFEVSKATAARVRKAQLYIELAYQHRRLLSHLPPIRRADQQSETDHEVKQSKSYNPLQYARNRKLRLREKCGIQSELEGWHDIDTVRRWVDAVIDSHPATEYDPADCVRLPPLSLHEEEDPPRDRLQASPRTEKRLATRRRPKSDWVTHPGDILADAYWLEQGRNKTRIQDRDNNPIYPADTQFRDVGWRRDGAPLAVPESLQKAASPLKEEGEESNRAAFGVHQSSLISAPELPSFRPAHEKSKASSRLQRGRRMLVGGKRRSRKMTPSPSRSSTSSSISESSDSDSEMDKRRGRHRPQSNIRDRAFDLPEGDPFAVPANPVPDGVASDKRSSVDENRLLRYLKLESVHRNSFSRRDSTVKPGDGERADAGSTEGHQDSLHEHNSSSRDSKTATHHFPNISINLSPPRSRSSSIATKKRPRVLASIREKQSSNTASHVDANDFAPSGSGSHSRDPSTDVDSRHQPSRPGSRGTSPFSASRRDSSPQADILPLRPEHRGSTISRASTRSAAPSDHSRIRGMFKGGRIAELVGHEVSRVGDFIWKREPPAVYKGRHPTSTRSSLSHASDTDEFVGMDGHPYKTPPRNARTSTSPHSSPSEPRRSYDDARQDSSRRLNIPNLPSFTSPFQKDREKQDKTQGLLTPGTPNPDHDPISAQAAQVRSRSKSPRLSRLAPPKLDTSGGSPEARRRDSYGFGSRLNLTKSQTASQMFNNAINSGSIQEFETPNSTTEFSNHVRKSVADIAQPDYSHRVHKQDILRVEALLLVSAVQANAIMASSSHRPKDFQQLIGVRDSYTRDVRLSRCESHVREARVLISRLANHDTQFDNILQTFSDTTVGKLHSELQVLEDTIENTLTPRVRNAADSAGELGIKLSTSSTLAVKDLNDIISEAFRMRKRGYFRWLKRFGYSAIAWGVVSLLWVIWAVVTSIKTVLGFVKALLWILRWLFWLN